jgi:hypothetical protein
MTVTKPIFTKLKIPPQRLLNNSYTEFHKNTTKYLVADTKSQTAGRGVIRPKTPKIYNALRFGHRRGSGVQSTFACQDNWVGFDFILSLRT